MNIIRFVLGVFKKCDNRKHQIEESSKPKAKTETKGQFNAFNNFNNRVFCFTGGLAWMERTQAMAAVRNFGGVTVRNMSRRVNVLVVGSHIVRRKGETKLTAKQIKAAELNESGAGIDIVSELEFQVMLDKAAGM